MFLNKEKQWKAQQNLDRDKYRKHQADIKNG